MSYVKELQGWEDVITKSEEIMKNTDDERQIEWSKAMIGHAKSMIEVIKHKIIAE